MKRRVSVPPIPSGAATIFQCLACGRKRYSTATEAIPAHVGMVEILADSKHTKTSRVGWSCCDTPLCRRRAVFKVKKLGYQNVNIWKLP